MLSLYITRHGETIWNTEERLQGWKNSPLTEKGVYHATLLERRLRKTPFEAIYSSSSDRAVHTAEIVKGERSFEVVKEDLLREISLGHWEGQTHKTLRETYKEPFDFFWKKPHLYQTETGETFPMLLTRAKKVLDSLTANHTSGNILLVTHAVFIKAIIAHVEQRPLHTFWDPPFIHDTSLTIIEWNGAKWNIVTLGDVSHREHSN
ncbi:histidine phosphatase family protein [Cytobacillus spongiae]|uniref:histidine phosphatase family protein n=1 Tax=Cytobacillus spongiae TaxID=2901381 RepID=UPI001F1BD600|nr:histidine phosphatase family protein [Cytobacillus spongiae]UII57735.1 histidine phosphatase family protein [Cytobacillus spongiae]